MNQLVFNWLVKNTPSCKEAVRLLSEAMDRRLPIALRIKLRLHFLICALCKRYMVQLRFLRRIMRRYSRQSDAEAPAAASLSTEARQRIKHVLHG